MYRKSHKQIQIFLLKFSLFIVTTLLLKSILSKEHKKTQRNDIVITVLLPPHEKLNKDIIEILNSLPYQWIEKEELDNSGLYQTALNSHIYTGCYKCVAIIKNQWFHQALNCTQKDRPAALNDIKIFLTELGYLSDSMYFLGNMSSGFLEVSSDLVISINASKEMQNLYSIFEDNLNFRETIVEKDLFVKIKKNVGKFSPEILGFYKKYSDIPLLRDQLQSYLFGELLLQKVLWEGKAKFIHVPWSLNSIFDKSHMNEHLSLQRLSFFFPHDYDLEKICTFCFYADLYQCQKENNYLKQQAMFFLHQLNHEQQRILIEYFPRSISYLYQDLMD